jgi:hypothetical protein
MSCLQVRVSSLSLTFCQNAGISLTAEQWEAFRDAVPSIEDAINKAWRVGVKSRFITFCLYSEKLILALYKGHSWQDPYVASRIPLNCKKVSLGACLLLSGVVSTVFRVASFEYLLTSIHRKFHMMNHLVMILASVLRLVKTKTFSIVILRRQNLSSVEN